MLIGVKAEKVICDTDLEKKEEKVFWQLISEKWEREIQLIGVDIANAKIK